MNKKRILVLIFLVCITGCSNKESNEMNSETMSNSKNDISEVESNMTYSQISMDEAKKIFETEGDYIIVDVRRTDEFAEGHIKDAINIPNESIGYSEPEQLPDKEQTIYVYCRSGNRSKQASEKLVNLGYTDIIEFGGIIDWTGEVVVGN